MAKTNKVRFYYGLFLLFMTVAVGVAFIIAVSQVYYSGLAENPDYPFELGRIREHILVPFILLICWIAAIIAGFVLSVIFPAAIDRATYKNNAKNLTKLKERMPASGGDEYLSARRNITKYEIIRLCVWCVALTFLLAAAIVILIYAFNASNYHSGTIKADALNLVKNVLSWTAAGLAVGIIAVVVDEVLVKRELAEVKTAIVKGDKKAAPVPKEVKRWAAIASSVTAGIIAALAVAAYVLVPIVIKGSLNLKQTALYAVVFVIAAAVAAGFVGYNIVKKYVPDKVSKIMLLVARIAVGVTAVTFIIVGALNGGANDVLVKAINICTECIGLG